MSRLSEDDKPRVFAEVARVLRPGGRFAVSDVIADSGMSEETRADMAAWTGCVAGALTEAEFRSALGAAGLVDVEIRETHRVHEHAAAVIIRARRPTGGCCDPEALTRCCEPAAREECCAAPVASGDAPPERCGCQA